MIKIILTFTLMTLFLNQASAVSLPAIQNNNDGLKSIEREDFDQAEQHFLASLADEPFDPVPRLNLGFTYEQQKRYDKALREYDSVLRLEHISEEFKFSAHFNAGNAAAKSKNVDLALKYFQDALSIRPDSLETKKNIELLFKAESGGGDGDSDSKSEDEKENKDQERKQSNNGDQESKENKSGENPQTKEEKFNSENLTKEDVKKIMEELMSQEKKIRALEYGGKAQEDATGKDW